VICVDTSVWIAALRDHTTPAALHLAELVEADAVIVPAPVRIEVLAGAPKRDLAALAEGFLGLVGVVPGHATWQRVEGWVTEAVQAGHRFGVVDLLIAATAAEHGARLWSHDAAFGRMARLGFVEVYAAP
jgi:predicted nucleic acid-binding protein